MDLVGIIAAAVGSMLVGFLWYSPMMFSKPWTKMMGYTESSMKKMQKQMGPMYGLSFLASIATAFVLSQVMSLMQVSMGQTPLMSAWVTAAMMWVGFVAPVQFTDVLFGGKRKKLFMINTGYQLASLLVMATVLVFV